MIGLYTRVSHDPVIFFSSLVIAVVVPVIVCWLIRKLFKGLWDNFTTFVVGFVYMMGIVLLAVFGPTFIDRSISYHLAFYAVEEERVDVDSIREAFSTEIFDKRVHDAVVTGFLKENADGSLSPTWKARLMYALLEPVGELTDSLGTYEAMKEGVR